MRKIQLLLFIALLVTFGLLFNLKQETSHVEEKKVAGEKLEQSGEVLVHFLDIGQGDATFIEFPDGQQMLVDCAIDGRILEALGRVMPYYDRDIDYLLITHPDLDHYGGCQEVLERFEVKNIVYTGIKKEYDQMWQSFWWAKENEGANYYEIEEEDVWNIASTTLHFLYPDHALFNDEGIPGLEAETNANNTSIVFRMDYGDNSLLMMGDAEQELEEYLLSTYGDQLDTDILKLGHHGSDSSSSQDFINAVSPSQAIASCGLDNKFGHPSRRVLKRLERAETTVWRTDLQGDITLKMRNNDFDISVR